MTKTKVLIITYYWPPAGGPGVQRWLKFVNYLPEFGVEPIVYIPSNPNYPLLDESLKQEVSKDVTIIKQPISEPYKLARVFSKNTSKTISKGIISEEKKQSLIERMLLFIRGNFFIPDARKNWVKPSVSYLESYFKEHRIDKIITSGPPHSLHLIGLELQEKLGVEWFADFRDPWTTIGYHKQLKLTKRAENKHKALEKKVLESADRLIVTSQVTKNEFSIITKKPIEVITNGYDTNSVKKPALDTKFTMSHIGSLLSKRNPEILWEVLNELTQENQQFSEDLELHFVGFISESILQTLKYYNLSNYVSNHGYLSHNQAIEFQKKSQLLLLVEINSEETTCIIPGKLFEYMVSERPILAFGPKGSDVSSILKETNTGAYFNYDAKNDLKQTILSHYKAYQEGCLKSHAIGLQKYSRKALTEKLAKLLQWES